MRLFVVEIDSLVVEIDRFRFLELEKLKFEVKLWRQVKNIWNLF